MQWPPDLWMSPQPTLELSEHRSRAARQAMAGAHELITEVQEIPAARRRHAEGPRRAAHLPLTEQRARHAGLLGDSTGNRAVIATAERPRPHLGGIGDAADGGRVQGSAGR